MADKDKSGLKSAFDLAMERMAAKGETLKDLSDDQKQAIADVAQRTTAKIAEAEILYQKRRSALNPETDAEKIRTVEEQHAAELRKLRRREEEDAPQRSARAHELPQAINAQAEAHHHQPRRADALPRPRALDLPAVQDRDRGAEKFGCDTLEVRELIGFSYY